MITELSDTNPRKLGDFDKWTLIYLQAIGDYPVRVAKTAEELGQPAPGGIPQGLQVLPSTGIAHVWWRGPLFLAALDATHTPAYLDTQTAGSVDYLARP